MKELSITMRRRAQCASIVLGGILAYGVGLWMVLLRHYQGGHNHGGPSLAVHWLGDSTLALPGVVIAVAGALTLARSLAQADWSSPAVRRIVAAGAAAPAASLAYAASFPLRDAVFGATEADALPPPLRVARDTMLALAFALPFAVLAASLVFSERKYAGLPRGRAVALAGGAAVLAAAALGGSVRAAAPPSVCPSAAPVKHFDVSAIDVDITLNRFGDHDPTGKMYVLTQHIPDVLAEETAALPNRVSTGLREDPIQPLVIRANEGDCVTIHFKNSTTTGPYGIHIDGLSFASSSSGDAVGQNAPSDVGPNGEADYTYYLPNTPTLEGAHYMRPGPANRNAVQHGLFGALVAEPPGSSY